MTVVETPQTPKGRMGILRHYYALDQRTPQGQTGSLGTWPRVRRAMCHPVPVCGSSRYRLPSACLSVSAKGSRRATGTFLRNPGPARLFPEPAPVRTGLLSRASRLQPGHSAGLRGRTSGVAAGPRAGEHEAGVPWAGCCPWREAWAWERGGPELSSSLGRPHFRDARREQSSAVVCLRYRCFLGGPAIGGVPGHWAHCRVPACSEGQPVGQD